MELILPNVRVKTHRDLTEGSVDAVLIASDQEIDSGIALLCFLDGEANVVIADFFDCAMAVRDFSGAFEPLNWNEAEKVVRQNINLIYIIAYFEALARLEL